MSASAPPTPMTRETLAKWVFWPAAVLILGFVLFAMVAPDAAASVFDTIQSDIISVFGWYYVLIAALFVAVALYLGFSRYGNIVLGKDGDTPQFSRFSWFALLFAAGMGIGLVFYGVSEPLAHYASPRPGVTGTPEQLAQSAMAQTFLHWGIHAWSIYIIVGLAIAYAVHRRGRPVSIRYAVEPLLGKAIHGRWGNVIDVTAVVGTLFGIATSLGLGVLQISSGLSSAGIAEPDTRTQVILIVVITIVTLFSLLTGLARGMKWLSNINLALAGLILLYVLFSGPTLFLLREFVQSIGAYIQGFVGLSFNVSAFQGEIGAAWQASWTTFYWGWWISWAPFVGIFIARVSKGRTVREFVWGVLLVPAMITFLWFAVMGGSALYREVFGDGGLIAADGSIDYQGSLFQVLEALPAGTYVTFGAILLIGIFFVTSSDSGSFVLSMLTSGGAPTPARWLRVFWACTTALVAIALLLTGGLGALQTAAIITALPFSVVMIMMVMSLFRAFDTEHRAYMRATREEFVEHVADHIGDHYGLEPATMEIEEARTRIRWRRRKKAGAVAGSTAPEPPAPATTEPPGPGAPAASDIGPEEARSYESLDTEGIVTAHTISEEEPRQ
ncbi:BCCT family transporter [Demequina sp. SYSU T00039]|uniref:BCCT family transporter n=1 Tax=Demequina lignilytica TaxID=3051663 RepID=A0AAW7M1W1_9MICO|nr:MULTISPECIES: BCCT family transporter [unclassified Demequina]MDN4478675.1 BCCT family transporter [Demequina sp. SYSU T00039-1]MDN4488653.1 BCCT family transporter [Demequina sp. SYSU T00039]